MTAPDRADTLAIDVADLVRFVPALRAGVQALRARERWAANAHAPTDASHAAQEAQALEHLANQLDACEGLR